MFALTFLETTRIYNAEVIINIYIYIVYHNLPKTTDIHELWGFFFNVPSLKSYLLFFLLLLYLVRKVCFSFKVECHSIKSTKIIDKFGTK